MAIPTFQFYPYWNVPSGITNSYPTTVSLILPVNYVVNEMVSFRCPLNCGMVEIDKKTAKILSVDTVLNTISVDLDSTLFNAFVFGIVPQIPMVIPAGEINTLAAAIRDNTRRPGYIPV